MRIVEQQRVFIDPPDDAPEWLLEAHPTRGSSGKARHVTRQAVWVDWGRDLSTGVERSGWVPRAWLGDHTVLKRVGQARVGLGRETT